MQTKRRHQERGGAWPADAPCRISTPAREGRGAGDTLTHSRRPPHPSPPSAPYSRLGTDPVARSQDLPTQPCPQPRPFPRRGNRQPRGGVWRRAGPGGALPTLAHPERLAVNGAPTRDCAARLGLGAWLSRTPRLPRAAGGGPQQGNPIPQNRLQSKPAPNFPTRVGSRGQLGDLERIPAAGRTARRTPHSP